MSMKDLSGGGFGEDFSEAKCISLGLCSFLSRFYKKSLYPFFSYFIA
jgi:hypothetical protein